MPPVEHRHDATVFETPIRNTSLPARRWRADQSENNVLLAILMAFLDWLFGPDEAAASPNGLPLTRPAIAALPAARPRFVLLASIHVPWPRPRD
jgi:hypothetical protein